MLKIESEKNLERKLNQLKKNKMTEQEANDILHEKYPQGYIRYNDLGRKSHTNRAVIVCFTEHGKDYRYTGGYESVLITLGCMEPVIYERPYKLENNIFINAVREAGSKNSLQTN